MATGHRKERPQGLSGGVGGVSGIGARVESFLHYYNVLARFWASNHATNFEPYDIRYLQRHPEINTLVSQASQVEEKCFRSKRPNFASKNAFSPSAALRAAACKARVPLGQVRQGEGTKTKAPRQRLEALFWLPLLDSNQRHPD